MLVLTYRYDSQVSAPLIFWYVYRTARLIMEPVYSAYKSIVSYNYILYRVSQM